MVVSRYIEAYIKNHLSEYPQMAFVSGPRQVGKTTFVKNLVDDSPKSQYFSWDNANDRTGPLQTPAALCSALSLDDIGEANSLCAIDEIHKNATWRDLLKVVFDTCPELAMIITGSGMLTQFGRGGDSLRGRYFPYTMHPFSVAELVRTSPSVESLIHPEPIELPLDQWDALLSFGGYPAPFLRANASFHSRWVATARDQLLREEVRDLTRVQELSQIERLAILLQQQVGDLTSYSYLSKEVGVSVDTIKRWIEILKSLYYSFSISPWYKNVSRALKKEPKYYLWDWSQVKAAGARLENLVACALLKAVHFWNETGRGQFALHFVRDKDKREVDFLVAENEEPWILVEVKSSSRTSLSPHLKYFKEKLGVPYAVQVAGDAEYHDADCVHLPRPMIVPARSFLSQLV